MRKGVQIALGVGSVIGLGATIAFTVKDTIDAVWRVEEKKKELGVDKLDFKTLLKTVAPCYVKSALTFTATGACMAGASAIGITSQATLAGVAGFATKSYNDYRSKLRELDGEAKDRQILEAVHRDKAVEVKDIEICTPTVLGNEGEGTIFPEDYDENEGEVLFHIDNYTLKNGVYFTSTVPKVMNALYHFQRNQQVECGTGYYQDELLEFLGIELPPKERDPKWTYSYLSNDNIYWVDFTISRKTDIGDGMVCRCIFPTYNPIPECCINEYGYADYEKYEKYRKLVEDKDNVLL